MQQLFHQSLPTLLTSKKVHAVILSKICIHTSNRWLIFTTRNKGSVIKLTCTSAPAWRARCDTSCPCTAVTAIPREQEGIMWFLFVRETCLTWISFRHWDFQVHHSVYVFACGKNFLFLQRLQKSSRETLLLTLSRETFYEKKKLWLKIFFCGFVELFYLTLYQSKKLLGLGRQEIIKVSGWSQCSFSVHPNTDSSPHLSSKAQPALSAPAHPAQWHSPARQQGELLLHRPEEPSNPHPTGLILPQSLLESQSNLTVEKINSQKIQGRRSYLHMHQLPFQGLQDCRKIK